MPELSGALVVEFTGSGGELALTQPLRRRDPDPPPAGRVQAPPQARQAIPEQQHEAGPPQRPGSSPDYAGGGSSKSAATPSWRQAEVQGPPQLASGLAQGPGAPRARASGGATRAARRSPSPAGRAYAGYEEATAPSAPPAQTASSQGGSSPPPRPPEPKEDLGEDGDEPPKWDLELLSEVLVGYLNRWGLRMADEIADEIARLFPGAATAQVQLSFERGSVAFEGLAIIEVAAQLATGTSLSQLAARVTRAAVQRIVHRYLQAWNESYPEVRLRRGITVAATAELLPAPGGSPSAVAAAPAPAEVSVGGGSRDTVSGGGMPWLPAVTLINSALLGLLALLEVARLFAGAGVSPGGTARPSPAGGAGAAVTATPGLRP